MCALGPIGNSVNTRVIDLSCGITSVRQLVLSQCTRVTEGQNYDSQDRAGTDARSVKIICISSNFGEIILICY